MKAYDSTKLAELGITSESYTNAGRTFIWPPIWGITLVGPAGHLCVEHTPRACDGDGRYYVRMAQYDPNSDLGSYPTQREAIAEALGHWYGADRPSLNGEEQRCSRLTTS
jgi:hypothetical protein